MEKDEDRRTFWACMCVAVSIVLTLLAATSCTQVEDSNNRIEPGIFYGSWIEKGREIESICTIGNYLEGESHILIEITNTVRDSTACCPIYVTSREFRKELRSVYGQEFNTLQFFNNAKRVKITRKMFDEIYRTYARY